MLPYWFLLGVIALVALIKGQADSRGRGFDPFLFYAGLLIALMIGFRYHVGGDWWTYQRYFKFAAHATLGQLLALNDPGYQFLNWAAQQFGGGVWLVNLACGMLFSWGLVRLARTQPYPWLCLVVAIPYLVIVVAMGYSRQGLAIGIIMAGFASLIRGGSVVRFAIYVTIAALFHRTAVVALPLGLIGMQRNILVNLLVVVGATLLLYDLMLADSVDHFVAVYVKTDSASQGAAIRVAMSMVPATLFLLFRRRLQFPPIEAAIWRNFAFAGFAALAALLLTRSSTVVDRLALYILPLQLAVLPRIAGPLVSPRLGKMLIVAYAFAVQFVWLNYADYSRYWIPYRFYPFADGVSV